MGLSVSQVLALVARAYVRLMDLTGITLDWLRYLALLESSLSRGDSFHRV